MENNWIITIGRQFCSGGAEIGHKVAKILNIPYYDKEIIDEAAGVLNMSAEDIKKHSETDEEVTSIMFDIAKICRTFFDYAEEGEQL
jgi:cytidylate kinase